LLLGYAIFGTDGEVWRMHLMLKREQAILRGRARRQGDATVV
jgi:hypothetical protein